MRSLKSVIKALQDLDFHLQTTLNNDNTVYPVAQSIKQPLSL